MIRCRNLIRCRNVFLGKDFFLFLFCLNSSGTLRHKGAVRKNDGFHHRRRQRRLPRRVRPEGRPHQGQQTTQRSALSSTLRQAFFFLAIFLVSFGIFPPLLTFRRLSADAVPPYVISSLAGSPRGRGRSSCCRPCQGANPPIPASFFSQNAGAAEQSATVNSLFWQSFWQKRPPHAHASSGDNRRLTNMPAHPFLLSPF